jgi:hypothetical protein
MKKLTLLIALISFSVLSNAQSLVEKSAEPLNINTNKLAVLWDNTNINTTTSGIISTEYGGKPVGQKLVNTADDFVIPVDGIWSIDSIRATGFTNSPTPIAQHYGVVIYSNNAGQPGTIIASDTLVPAAGVNATFINFHFSTPWVINQAGTYWLSVFGVYDTATVIASGRWNWYTGPTAVGLVAHLQDQAALFGGFPWTSLTALGVPNPSCNFIIYGSQTFVPVELSSFSANVNNGNVLIKWSTASELNNKGFEVQKKIQGSDFVTIAFIEGMGTTAEKQDYSFSDNSVLPGKYTYRLKQNDFDGKFEYSNEIEVEVSAPSVYTLSQNYPNPFNPNTNIIFSLAVESKVKLEVFNLLGEEVEMVINSNLSAGEHKVDFNATGLNSGIYFYKLTASGIDGSSFSSIKKMTLMK